MHLSNPNSVRTSPNHRWAALLTGVTSLALLTGCPGDDSDGGDPESSFTVHSSRRAVAVGTPIVFSGDLFAFLASESSGSEGAEDMNGDLDTNDSIATVMDYVTREETSLDVAARHLAWLGTTLFMEVREDEDGRDWDEDMATDNDEYSLLRWTLGDEEPTFLTSLDPNVDTRFWTVNDERLFVLEAVPISTGVGTTSMSAIESDAVNLLLPVTTTSDALNGLTPRFLSGDEGLLFCLLDEDIDGDLNGDTDTLDDVLAVIDGSRAAMELHSTEMAYSEDDGAVRARCIDDLDADWLVAFLVDELAQGENLNDSDLFGAGWIPEGCPGVDDADTDDHVLHYLFFGDWVADSVTAPIRNTGLAGSGRAFVTGEHVGTIVQEDESGDCDLNGDGDRLDRVARWVFADPDPGDELMPPGGTDLMVALSPSSEISGPTGGVAELDDRIVALVGEEEDGRNHDLDLDNNFNLIAWIDPASPTSWEFDHGSGSAFFAGATWMTETLERNYVAFAAPESVSGSNFNIPSNSSGPDTDEDDFVPVLGYFDEDRLFPGLIPIAVRETNAGFVVTGRYAFGRAYEADDSRDLNDDGDTDDDVIFRHAIDSQQTFVMSSLNNIGGRGALELPGGTLEPAAGAFIADEGEAGRDYNRDGDSEDFVVRYFRFD